MERLEVLGCDPLEGLARIASDPNTDTALRARVYADLLPYLYPKRKAVEVSGPYGGAIRMDDEQMREQVMRKLLGPGYAADGAGDTL
jgi:hypothetical protein